MVRYTLVYMPPYHGGMYPPYHPVHTTTLATPCTSHTPLRTARSWSGPRLPVDEALGSTLRLIMEKEPLRVFKLFFLLGLVWECAQSYSGVPRIKNERLDSERVFPYCFTLGMARILNPGLFLGYSWKACMRVVDASLRAWWEACLRRVVTSPLTMEPGGLFAQHCAEFSLSSQPGN